MTIDWNPTRPKVNKFLRNWAFGVSLLGGALWWRRRPSIALALWGGVAVLGILGFIFPAVGRRIYKAWMGMAFAVDFILVRSALTVFYFLVFWPAAQLLRWGGRDPLRLRRAAPGESYWQNHPAPKEQDHRHLF